MRETPSLDFSIYTMAGPPGFARIEITPEHNGQSNQRLQAFYCDAPSLRRLAAQLELIAVGLDRGIGVSTRPEKTEPAF